MNVNVGLTWFKALMPLLASFIWCQIQELVTKLKPWARRNWKLELILSSCRPLSLSQKHRCNHMSEMFIFSWQSMTLTKQPLRWHRDLGKPRASHQSPRCVFCVWSTLTRAGKDLGNNSKPTSPEQNFTKKKLQWHFFNLNKRVVNH